MKIATIVGARPQFIKAALVSKEIRKNNREILIHTGQHYDFDLSQVFFDELGIPTPEYNLGIGSGSHAVQTGKAMIAIETVLLNEKPDLVLVYGDTNSTLAGALAAAKLHIEIAHIEAGVRMFDRTIPEEINRILTDQVSSLLFTPTETASKNLLKEGIHNGVYFTGDVMLDNYLHFREIARIKSDIMKRLGLQDKRYILFTIHRERNTNDGTRLGQIVEAILAIKQQVVFPMHPRTKTFLAQYSLLDRITTAPNILLIEPVGYLDSLILTEHAKLVLTDSGGLQKEAYFSRTPCLTMDEATAWPETIEDGWNVLLSSNLNKITDIVNTFEPKNAQTAKFGNGKAVQNIVQLLCQNHGKN